MVAATTLRAAALAALFGAASLLAPLQSARAQTAENAPPQHTAPIATKAHWTRHETIDQRIASLHESLKITPDEETQWADVAQTMRDNEATVQKLAADARTTPVENATAVDDLKAYQKFAQAHVDGLAKMTASFETLYTAMPDPQKKIADQVFANFGHKAAHRHS
jgi:Ni/Co efflux regulator RcnB